jgi:predicted transcriptional regulator
LFHFGFYKLDTQKLETVESEKRKANKSMAYFKKQNSEYREINRNQKQVILQLQRDLSDKDRNIDNLIAQVNELIEDKMSVETFSEFCFLKYAMLLFSLRFSDSTVSSFCVSSFSFFISAFCSLITFL